MGCYGLSVTRTLQAIIEYSNDDNGIVWPAAVSPWQVCITALDVEADGEVMQVATQIHEELNTAGIDTILDDRELRPGIKFKDSELVGFPVRLGIGADPLRKGTWNSRCVRSGREAVPVSEAVARVKAVLA